MARAGKYNLIQDYFASESKDGVVNPATIVDDTYVTADPYWILAVFRLGSPVSFSRREGKSNKNASDGALLRNNKPLVITDDCFSISVTSSKSNHLKTMSASLKQTTVNYLVEVLPGDYVLGWIMNNRTKFESVQDRLDKLDPDDPCNRFMDGLKFVGRIDDVYKSLNVDPHTGTKNVMYAIKASGFQELDTQLYYDYALASSDVMKQDIGTYLARLGSSINKIFGQQTKGQIEQDNVNRIVPELVDLIVGTGPKRENTILVRNDDGTNQAATPSTNNDSPYAYLVPLSVGHVLGRHAADNDDKVAGVMSYAQLMEMVIGTQAYSNMSGYQMFVPDIDPDNERTAVNRKFTKQPMMGTFLPMMPDFANRPLWSVFQQYLNPAINELYTALKVNDKGLVVPMVTMRQIPFTTDAFVQPSDPPPDANDLNLAGGEEGPMTAGQYLRTNFPVAKANHNTTKFLDLPRWKIPATLVRGMNVGRSNASRVNFVHVYGQSAYLADSNVPIQAQMIQNPPIRDDLDIMRSGMRPYMMTVECWVNDQVGKVAGYWMGLIADWTMGSHLTLNGNIELYGVQSPIAEGDNVEFEGIVYHVMTVTHTANINPGNGMKDWSTSLAVCNGMRDIDTNETSVQPLYPGLKKDDNTKYDPGLTAEHQVTTGGDSDSSVKWDDPEVVHERASRSQLADTTTVDKDPGGELEDVSQDPEIKGLL